MLRASAAGGHARHLPARWPGGPRAEMSASVTTSLGWRTQGPAPYAVTAPSEVVNPRGHLAPDRARATPHLGIFPRAARLRGAPAWWEHGRISAARHGDRDARAQPIGAAVQVIEGSQGHE